MDRHSGLPRTGKIGAYKASQLCKELEATAAPFQIKIAPSFELPPLKPNVMDAPKASPAPRYTTVANGKAGWANVVDAAENRIVGYYYAEIAAECAAKLNAAHEPQPAKLQTNQSDNSAKGNTAKRPLFPVSTVAVPCGQCGVNVITDGDTQPVKCPACNRMAVDSALAELIRTAKALRAAAPPFDVLTLAEWAEQLAALIGGVDELPDATVIDLAAQCAESIARRMASVPEPVRTIEPDYDTPIYTLANDGEPSPSERDEIEARIEVSGDNIPPMDAVDPYFHDLDIAVGVTQADEPLNFAQYAADVCGFNPRPAA
jgi:hypothetical protein